MSYFQGRDRRKPTGGRLHTAKEKRRYELGSSPVETGMSSDKDLKKESRCYGGNVKVRLDKAAYVNVTDPKTNVTKKIKVMKVKNNPSNVDYARRGVITKGAILETELGDVRVTSRPGQHGGLSGLLSK